MKSSQTLNNLLTQDFISTATGIDEAMVKIEKQEIVEHLSENSILVQPKYAGASTRRTTFE